MWGMGPAMSPTTEFHPLHQLEQPSVKLLEGGSQSPLGRADLAVPAGHGLRSAAEQRRSLEVRKCCSPRTGADCLYPSAGKRVGITPCIPTSKTARAALLQGLQLSWGETSAAAADPKGCSRARFCFRCFRRAQAVEG